MGGTKLIQCTNVSQSATLDQLRTLFGFLGKIEEIHIFPKEDTVLPVTSRVCFVKYEDESSVGVAQHLTNTVFIDRPLIVVPCLEVPEEHKALQLVAPNNGVGGMVTPTAVAAAAAAAAAATAATTAATAATTATPGAGLLPTPTQPLLGQIASLTDPAFNITSLTDAAFDIPSLAATAAGTTPSGMDPTYAALGLPQPPPLNNVDPSKIEEIRRTIYVGNLDSAQTVTAEQLLTFFQGIGEVKYVRMAGDETQPTRFAFVEFTEQASVAKALTYNGVMFAGRPLKINHSNNAIVKPPAKTAEAAQRELAETMKQVRDAQALIQAAIEPAEAAGIKPLATILPPTTKEITVAIPKIVTKVAGKKDETPSEEKKKSRRSRSRSRSRHSSRSRSRRSRTRSRSRRRSRSRDRRRSRRSRTRTPPPPRRRSRTPPRRRSPRKRSRTRSPPPRRRVRSRSRSRDKRSRSRDRPRRRSKTPPRSYRVSSSDRGLAGSGRKQTPGDRGLAGDGRKPTGSPVPARRNRRSRTKSLSRSKSRSKSRSRSTSPRRSGLAGSGRKQTGDRGLVGSGRKQTGHKKEKKSRDRERSRERDRSSRKHKKDKERDRERKDKDKERDRSADRGDKDGGSGKKSKSKVKRDYDEEEKGYDSDKERDEGASGDKEGGMKIQVVVGEGNRPVDDNMDNLQSMDMDVDTDD